MPSPSWKLDDRLARWIRSFVRSGVDLIQQSGSNIPMLAGIGDDSDRLLVVTRENPHHLRASCRLEPHSLANPKIQHLHMGPHLAQKTKAGHNLVIEFKQLFFRKRIDVDVVHCSPFFECIVTRTRKLPKLP